jgi:hypothetical protein
MQSKQDIPWARITIEATAIIVSILVAFAIDAWWEDRRERQEERDYLSSLRQELIIGLDLLANRESVHKEIIESHEDLINQIQAEDRASDGSLLYMFSLLSRPTVVDLPRAVFDDLVSSGGTQLIRSDEIRIALAVYGRRLREFETDNDAAWATWEQRLQPYLEGRIPRRDRLLLGSFGRDRPSIDFSFGRSQHESDFDGVLADPVFEDMLAERWLRVLARSERIQGLQKLMNEIVGLINNELSGVGF